MNLDEKILLQSQIDEVVQLWKTSKTYVEKVVDALVWAGSSVDFSEGHRLIADIDDIVVTLSKLPICADSLDSVLVSITMYRVKHARLMRERERMERLSVDQFLKHTAQVQEAKPAPR